MGSAGIPDCAKAETPVPGGFANPEVLPDSLPRAATVDWQPLHPHYARRLQAGALIRIGVLAAVVAAAHVAVLVAGFETLSRIAVWPLRILWALCALGGAWAVVKPLIVVPRCGYAVREKDILYRSGVLWRAVRVVPFSRVQHTRTDSGVLDRRFGLANLTVFPAGAGGHKIPGLGTDTAENLRAYVSERIEAEKLEAADTGS